MCYTCLSVLNNIIDENKIDKLRGYFLGLTPNNRDLITVSKIANALEINNETAVKVILKCEDENILRRHFGIRCPNCGMLIKEIPKPSLEGISINECYSCDEEINISKNDIVILFKLIQIEIPFDCGQQRGNNIEDKTSIVAKEDTLESFKIMCEIITSQFQEERLRKYKENLDNKKGNKIHKKAVKCAERNRIINIILNSLCIVVAIIIVCGVYFRYGFSKLSLFTGFAGFVVPFMCNYILKEIFMTDIKRIEEKLLVKE